MPPQAWQVPHPHAAHEHMVFAAGHLLPEQHSPPSWPQQVPFSQEPPSVQVVPPQHFCPGPPHAVQVPDTHSVPVPVHLLPEQHGPFKPPQQVPPSQEPLVHSPPGQHAFPGAPHASQFPAVQVVYCCVHRLLAQHGPPTAPQHTLDSQRPELHPLRVMPTPLGQHGWPGAPQFWQVPAEQKQLSAPMQALPVGQQGWPELPQIWQVPAEQKALIPSPTQAVPVVQQGWRGLPQIWQVPAKHCATGVWQGVPLQHGPLSMPHVWQVPAQHTRPESWQVLPGQHGLSGKPQ